MTKLVLLHLFLFIASGKCIDPEIQLLLFTVDGQAVQADPALLHPQATTVLIIHGWLANGIIPWIIELGQLYQSIGNYNVLLLDWSKEAASINYVSSVRAIESVAYSATNQILNLFVQAGINNLLNVHFMGHSLGAHVAGSMAYILNSQYNLKIGRLTGFDVAAPLFEIPIKNLTPFQFRKGRAVFTDAIHTSGLFIGQRKANSDADFYVNGGLLQETCGESYSQLKHFTSCSHESSHVYYAQTLLRPYSLFGCQNRNGVLGNPENQCVGDQIAPMGEFVPWNITGVYWVNTNASATDVGL